MVREPTELLLPIVAIVEIVFEALLRVKLPLPINAIPLALSLTIPEMVKFPAPPNVAEAESRLTAPEIVDADNVLELIIAPVPSPP